MIFWRLELVGFDDFGFDVQSGLVGDGVRRDGQRAVLESVVSLAVVGGLDVAAFARCDGLARIVARRAAATRAYAGDNQGRVARVGEMEGVCDHFALQQSAEIVFGLVESDDGLSVAGL